MRQAFLWEERLNRVLQDAALENSDRMPAALWIIFTFPKGWLSFLDLNLQSEKSKQRSVLSVTLW
jgi:hypothetical protein